MIIGMIMPVHTYTYVPEYNANVCQWFCTCEQIKLPLLNKEIIKSNSLFCFYLGFYIIFKLLPIVQKIEV